MSLCDRCKYNGADPDEPICAYCGQVSPDIDVPMEGCHKYVQRCGQYKAAPDQSAKQDAGKLQITLVPTQIIRDIAEVRMYGNKKYGSADNWKQVEPVRYRDALMRHLLAYIDDPESVDAESGLPHLWHAACNMAFLCEMEVLNDEE